MWNEVKAYKELKNFETAYVVKLFNFKHLAEAKPCFRFWHPNHSSPIDNRRYTFMSFKSTDNATIHGMAGYFEAMLYKDIAISINPKTFSEGMFSWFPLYFPIRVRRAVPSSGGCHRPDRVYFVVTVLCASVVPSTQPTWRRARPLKSRCGATCRRRRCGMSGRSRVPLCRLCTTLEGGRTTSACKCVARRSIAR